MSRIVITTWGSLGDLHPYLAIALELHRRGHQAVMATSPCYREKVESLGLEFRSVRPDCDWLQDGDAVRRLSHPRWGLLRVGRELVMPALAETYEDTLTAARGADLLVAMHASYAARLVAEKTAIPWVSAVHIPLVFLSAHDPPVLDVAPLLSRKLRVAGPALWRPLLWFGKRATRFIGRDWYRLRKKLGLPPVTDGNPLFDSHSPLLVLALFSSLLAERQPDWPRQTILTGFPFYEEPTQAALPESVASFLEEGPPPIVFTLGSAVSGHAGSFFEQSARCAKILNRRAVLIVGRQSHNCLTSLPPGVIAAPYAPYAELFPRAAAIVHHGGVGTTAHAMRSGRPMLVVPHAWDQPDHAHRATRLGIARTLTKGRYTPQRAAAELSRLLDDPAYAERASRIRQQVLQERGVQRACDALENVLQQKSTR
ncbi:MAG: nucleotide disphospho-sugar-binding domain-containing protein [Pirellulales bacterium]